MMVDAGDFSQGGIYVSVNKGKAAIDMMNAAGYDVVTLGNHEFDYGLTQLMDNLKDAKFQAICCNVYSEKTGGCPYTASGDTAGKSKADLGSLAWDASNFVWKWNGTVAGGFTPITSSGFSSAIGSASSSFKSWLEEKGVLGKDQLGTDRGSGSWWPGAYQN